MYREHVKISKENELAAKFKENTQRVVSRNTQHFCEEKALHSDVKSSQGENG